MSKLIVLALVSVALLTIAPRVDVAGAVVARGEWKPLGAYLVTGYCPCVRSCGKSDGITADGTYAPTCPDRVVAAPKEFPFGTRLWIEGVGIVTVHDRGGAVRGQHVDLFFRNHSEARRWGVQKLEVFIRTGASELNPLKPTAMSE